MTPTNRSLTSVVIPLLLLLFAISALAVYFARETDQKQSWVFHTYQVIDDSKSLNSFILQAETNQRGYLITGQKSFLDQYYASLPRVGQYLGKLKSAISDNTAQQDRLREIEDMVARRLDVLARAVDLQQHSGPEAAQALVAEGEGVQAMREIRARLVEFVSIEREMLKQRQERADSVRGQTEMAFYTGSLLALILLLGISIILARSNFRLGQAEQKLQSEAILLQGTLDSIRDGISTFDADGNLRAFNMRFFDLLSLPFDLAREGTPIEEFRKVEAQRDLGVFNHQFLFSDDLDRGFRRLSLNGREIDLYRTLLKDGGTLIGCLDVTEQVQAENISRQAQKMEAIGHLTGGIAHDFNNLLQVISANLDLLTKDVSANPKSAERLQNAIAGVERGSQLTQQLLAFARRQPLDPRPVNLGRLIQEMTELLRRTLGERIDVEAIIAGGLWNTSIDPVQVENSVLNLAINARDAMPDGGKVTIEISNAVLDDNYAADHHEVMSGQYVMLAVSDTGLGMAPEILSRVFEPFFSTKPEGRGTGLGLSQVYGFVKQSGGHVKIYSEQNHGTTVRIYLPRTRKPQDVVTPTREGPVVGGHETILVVEDDAGVRAAAIDLLKDLGYSVLKAENADEAVALLESGARPDLLFTDVVMPGQINTKEFARRAKVMCPNMAVLFTSGYTQNAIVHNGKLDDDVFLLSKPYRKNELARKVRSVLDMPSSAFDNLTVLRTPAAAAPETASTASLKKILVVEDEPLVRMSMVDMLEELGHEVEEADNAQSALDLLGQDREIGIMITDLGLQGMSGQELIGHVQKSHANVRIIVASGYDGGANPLPGKIVYLTKPFQLADIKKALARTLSQTT